MPVILFTQGLGTNYFVIRTSGNVATWAYSTTGTSFALVNQTVTTTNEMQIWQDSGEAIVRSGSRSNSGGYLLNVGAFTTGTFTFNNRPSTDYQLYRYAANAFLATSGSQIFLLTAANTVTSTLTAHISATLTTIHVVGTEILVGVDRGILRLTPSAALSVPQYIRGRVQAVVDNATLVVGYDPTTESFVGGSSSYWAMGRSPEKMFRLATGYGSFNYNRMRPIKGKFMAAYSSNIYSATAVTCSDTGRMDDSATTFTSAVPAVPASFNAANMMALDDMEGGQYAFMAYKLTATTCSLHTLNMQLAQNAYSFNASLATYGWDETVHKREFLSGVTWGQRFYIGFSALDKVASYKPAFLDVFTGALDTTTSGNINTTTTAPSAGGIISMGRNAKMLVACLRVSTTTFSLSYSYDGGANWVETVADKPALHNIVAMGDGFLAANGSGLYYFTHPANVIKLFEVQGTILAMFVTKSEGVILHTSNANQPFVYL